MGNAGDGINVDGAADNTIGGTIPAARNIISGNTNAGVYLNGADTTGNVVAGNFIGTNAAGTAALGNTIDGILVNAAGNTIGGTAAGAGNVVSGNTLRGIYIARGSGSTLIQGNFIGTNFAGTAAIANGQYGIDSHGTGDTIGGTTAGAGNVISGNVDDGIFLDVESGSTLIQGNFIGTDVAGSAALANGGDGVLIQAGATADTIGGTASAPATSSRATPATAWTRPAGDHDRQPGRQGNFIGTDTTGEFAIGNAGPG